MKSIVRNAMANATQLGNLMAVISPDTSVIGIMDHIIDCAYKLAELEEERPNVWDNAKKLENCWDSVTDTLAHRLVAKANDHDDDRPITKITKKEIRELMPA